MRAIFLSPPRLASCLLLWLPGACASSAGEWPSLAHRPGEVAAPSPCDKPAAATATTDAAPPPPAPPVAAPDATVIDIAATTRRLADTKSAWTEARRRAEAAVNAAGTAAPGETTWATAELELSRLESRGTEFRDIADGLRGVLTPLEQAAWLRADAEAAYDVHIATYNALRARLGKPAD